MTTFCLVHGAWRDDACWGPLTVELVQRGHDYVTPVLPLEQIGASFEDYAAAVIESLAGREAPVLVGHSLASAVVPLVAVKRSVRLLVYLCPAMGGFPRSPDTPPFMREDFDLPPMNSDDCSWWPRERAVTQMYGRIDRQLAERLATRLRPQSRAVFTHPYPLERPPEVPSAFIHMLEDELFADTWSRWIRAGSSASRRSSYQGGTSRCSNIRLYSPRHLNASHWSRAQAKRNELKPHLTLLPKRRSACHARPRTPPAKARPT